ncbi:hypothetical protein KIPB_002638, partial [Kipferlia bialata]
VALLTAASGTHYECSTLVPGGLHRGRTVPMAGTEPYEGVLYLVIPVAKPRVVEGDGEASDAEDMVGPPAQKSLVDKEIERMEARKAKARQRADAREAKRRKREGREEGEGEQGEASFGTRTLRYGELRARINWMHEEERNKALRDAEAAKRYAEWKQKRQERQEIQEREEREEIEREERLERERELKEKEEREVMERRSKEQAAIQQRMMEVQIERHRRRQRMLAGSGSGGGSHPLAVSNDIDTDGGTVREPSMSPVPVATKPMPVDSQDMGGEGSPSPSPSPSPSLSPSSLKAVTMEQQREQRRAAEHQQHLLHLRSMASKAASIGLIRMPPQHIPTGRALLQSPFAFPHIPREIVYAISSPTIFYRGLEDIAPAFDIRSPSLRIINHAYRMIRHGSVGIGRTDETCDFTVCGRSLCDPTVNPHPTTLEKSFSIYMRVTISCVISTETGRKGHMFSFRGWCECEQCRAQAGNPKPTFCAHQVALLLSASSVSLDKSRTGPLFEPPFLLTRRIRHTNGTVPYSGRFYPLGHGMPIEHGEGTPFENSPHMDMNGLIRSAADVTADSDALSTVPYMAMLRHRHAEARVTREAEERRKLHESMVEPESESESETETEEEEEGGQQVEGADSASWSREWAAAVVHLHQLKEEGAPREQICEAQRHFDALCNSSRNPSNGGVARPIPPTAVASNETEREAETEREEGVLGDTQVTARQARLAARQQRERERQAKQAPPPNPAPPALSPIPSLSALYHSVFRVPPIGLNMVRAHCQRRSLGPGLALQQEESNFTDVVCETHLSHDVGDKHGYALSSRFTVKACVKGETVHIHYQTLPPDAIASARKAKSPVVIWGRCTCGSATNNEPSGYCRHQVAALLYMSDRACTSTKVPYGDRVGDGYHFPLQEPSRPHPKRQAGS